MITIVLADDHEIVREGFRHFLQDEPDFIIVGEAGTGHEVLRLVVRHKPDVLIIDLQLPDLLGTEVAARVRVAAPETHVILLSMYDSEPYVQQALENGARAYVLKASKGAELKEAVRAVMQGRRYLSPKLAERQDPLASLTPREQEIFHLAAQGLSNKDIGERLYISPRTVDKHCENLMGKLKLQSRAELMQVAVTQGLLVAPGSQMVVH